VAAAELAVYADAVAGEAAALAARAERARSRLRQAAIERAARAALPATTVTRLEALGLLGVDAARARSDLAECERGLAAVVELQAWIEAQLREAESAAFSEA
jgi:hypothetical protein